MSKPIHVLHTFANNATVPYLSWFAERAAREGNLRYTFVNMHPDRPAMIDEMAALGFTCHWIRYDDRHRKTGLLRALPPLYRHIRKHQPQIVHCNLFDDTVPGLIAARLAGVPVRVITRQDTGYHWMHAPRWLFVDRWNARLATDIITVSDEAREHLIANERLPADKITRVHNGIPPGPHTAQDPAAIAELRTRFGIADSAPVIGTVARFIPWKGYRHIVDAARIIIQRHPRARFLLCGQGDQEPEVRRWIQEEGLQDHVLLTGRIERRLMPSFYGLLDAYMHAAVLEPFGLVYAEAMMNRVPVVSTSTGAARDAITDGMNGMLAAERSGEALAAAMERLLTADRRAIGEAGRATALRMYSFDTMWNGTLDVYRNALARP
ncbi:MAG: glycosyltransferase family 4 protein [Flavobacteriales bacterium]